MSDYLAVNVGQPLTHQIPPWLTPWIPVAGLLLLIPIAKITLGIIRRGWLAGVERVPIDRQRARQRVETLISFFRSVVYFALIFLAIMQSLQVLFPKFDPATATGALSIVALVLTGMFRDVVVDVVKGLDILFGGHYAVGDYIRVGNFAGYVVDFQLKYTKLRSASGEEIIINNAACIPSRRFPEGWVTNYVDIPLANAADEARAREQLDAVGAALVTQVEAVKERPTFQQAFPLVPGAGTVLRYAVKVLPGATWALDDRYLPLIRAALDKAEIPRAKEISFFFMNDMPEFRTFFNRQPDPMPEKADKRRR